MSTKLALTLAAVLALVAIPSGHIAAAPPPVAFAAAAPISPVVSTAVADASTARVHVAELSPAAMGAVRGAGFWSKLLHIVKTVTTWIFKGLVWIINQKKTPQPDPPRRTDLGYVDGADRTDNFVRNDDQNDYLDANGNVMSSSTTQGAEEFQYTEQAST